MTKTLPFDPKSVPSTEWTADLIAKSSEAVVAETPWGTIRGRRAPNGTQVFLTDVPYALPVRRWTDPQPLPEDHRYEDKEYISDGIYCAQPSRVYPSKQLTPEPTKLRLGLGEPSECPFFADIYVPSSIDLSNLGEEKVPVRVFVHGGFMQWGSTSGTMYNQQFWAAEERQEVRVLVGHRLSVLGFLASAYPKLEGNYGVKDVWCALEWLQRIAGSFGGDAAQVHLSGLSGGAHLCHQLLHHAAREGGKGNKAPFISCLLQSNAILGDPVPASERQVNFDSLCRKLGLNPRQPGILDALRDEALVPTLRLMRAVDSLGVLGTFRCVVEPGWVEADTMAYQATRMGDDLRAAGVVIVVVGEVLQEEVFYATTHATPTPADIAPNLHRYFSTRLSSEFVDLYDSFAPLAADADRKFAQRRFGTIMANAQVYVPARLLAADLIKQNFPVVRYSIECVAKSVSKRGLVTHSGDTVLQHLQVNRLTPEEREWAWNWWNAVDEDVKKAQRGEFKQRPNAMQLTLDREGNAGWRRDMRWPKLMGMIEIVRPGEKMAKL
ncbi:hypothetical protein A1Q2_00546 [Trichosporon asahii var. asahii CBS 8904]|uniref:Carboxylic ester hydrolase n=1 Tax=Trichosporon asahii var. asahii (strain CBS 8904) TaxID=1220162 RepID=K1VM19_TRIAC|nr:hypothetical protein A1Q2_00546 [Trichosporon asahii var. asahii CBS 8904]